MGDEELDGIVEDMLFGCFSSGFGGIFLCV